jgi:Transposase DDE domain
MPPKYDILSEKEQESQHVSQEMAQQLELFLSPLLVVLDTLLDKRLVRTFLQSCIAILRFRNAKQALLLSELGSYLDGIRGLSTSAPAGTKRLGNLIRSIKWTMASIDQFLLNEADTEVSKLKAQGKRILCIWDGSVVEKPESRVAEGLCPVTSSKAKRLNRSRKGLVFNMPAARPVMVTGMQWTGALIAGVEGTIKVALMSWWTTKGDDATKLREQEEALLRTCVRKWGDLLIHVFDRGYASGPWLQLLQALRGKFIIRWKKGHYFVDAKGMKKKLWQIGQGKRYVEHKLLFDPQTGIKLPCDIWWAPVWHPSYAYQLYVVKVRVRKKVWYLLTNERVITAEQAWEVVFLYRRRWQIETSFRYGKSELALESPRVWSFENRLKLLGIVTLVYAFLLHLLDPTYKTVVQSLLRLKCHRTGKRCREILAPLYRLRWALSRLWNETQPHLERLFSPPKEVLRGLHAVSC